MWTKSLILRHIQKFPEHQIFTTRELLIDGTRASVDQATRRLVNTDRIVRLARGVFAKSHSKLHTPYAVATAKANAFGKQLLIHGKNLAKALDSSGDNGTDATTFMVNGPTSSFRFGKLVIHLKGNCPRKTHMGETKAGQAVRMLWFLGKRNFDPRTAMAALKGFSRPDRIELESSPAWMPSWLSDYLVHGKNHRSYIDWQPRQDWIP